jgi:tRNA pseudouridine55 synthase
VAEQASGLVLLDKPRGCSSFAAIAALRPLVGRKVGHAGTLDPFATGLLLVVTGRATRLATYLTGLDKQYHATIRFGATSTTDDPEGVISETARRTTRAAVQAALDARCGVIRQAPPAASAIRIDGERSYARFRRGEQATPPVRSVTISQLALAAFDAEAQTATITVTCSKGTYIRALARDIGAAVGAGGYCETLRRTMIGSFDVRDAAPLATILAEGRGGWWRDPIDALPHLPRRVLDRRETDRISHGGVIDARDETGLVRLVADGALIGVGRRDEQVLRPVIVVEAAR